MIAILDIGKTNKKCFVFDEDYRIVFEQTTQLPETTDEDGYPCEDVNLLRQWVCGAMLDILEDKRWQIRAVNVTTYGASFVYLDAAGHLLTPLYNYLKPFPEDLKKQFFDTYGGEAKIARETASPVLGNLNSGMQLYWLKYHKPLIFNQIRYSLHLPQYIACLIQSVLHESGGVSKDPAGLYLCSNAKANVIRPIGTVSLSNKYRPDGPGTKLNPSVLQRYRPSGPFGAASDYADYAVSEITSIGCHTMLWDFRKNDYHEWVKTEGIIEKFPPLVPPNPVRRNHAEQGSTVRAGAGLHDSSAALIPYLTCFDEPFVLISTGTWCISLNPFNPEPLTTEELENDCLCYMTYEGKPVKAARYFGGNEHEKWIKGLAQAFDKPPDYYKSIAYDPAVLKRFHEEKGKKGTGAYPFENYETAYHFAVRSIVRQQYQSTKLVLTKTTRRIFVDGGFSKNEIYMNLLANAFPKLEVCAAEVAQATALGAAIAMHAYWNEKPLPKTLILLK